jgi:mycothiol synthase
VATPSRDGWEVALTAGTGRLDVPTATALLLRLTADARGSGHGVLRWRVPEATPEHHAIATAAGYDSRRALVQMRRPLPAFAQPDLDLRSFVPGADDTEWLRVNNAAFAWHPEQGGWGSGELAERLAEPWVDLDGFLIHPDGAPGSPIDGFCWTKIHRDLEPMVGEIFIIAVDPERTGRGLGRALVLNGLDWLTRHGCAVGMLYTEADNDAAVGLYSALGFEVHHEVRVFTFELDA